MIHSTHASSSIVSYELYLQDQDSQQQGVTHPHYFTEGPPFDKQLEKFFPTNKTYSKTTSLKRAPFVGQTGELYIPSVLHFLNWQKLILEKEKADMSTFNLVYHEMKTRDEKGQKAIKIKIIDVDVLNITSSSKHQYNVIHPHGEIHCEAISKSINLYDYVFPAHCFSNLQNVFIF